MRKGPLKHAVKKKRAPVPSKRTSAARGSRLSASGRYPLPRRELNMKESFLQALEKQIKRDSESEVIDEPIYGKWGRKIRDAKKKGLRKVFQNKNEGAILKEYTDDVKKCGFKPGWEEKEKKALPGEEWRDDLVKIIELKELHR